MEIETDQDIRQLGDPCPTVSADGAIREDLQGLDMKVIKLLDATDTYLKLYDALSQAMRQGWLEIASARYSMGSSRISEALFSLKPRSAYTYVSVEHADNIYTPDVTYRTKEMDGKICISGVKQTSCFTLHKWTCLESKNEFIGESEAGFRESREGSASQLRHRPLSHSSDKAKDEAISNKGSLETSAGSIVSQVQKRKSEALSLFGSLVSPQLRFAQVSFETAIETLVQIANARNTMLSAFAEISKEKEYRIGHIDFSTN